MTKENKKPQEKVEEKKKEVVENVKKEIGKSERKKEEQPKKTEAVVNVKNVPISTKHSIALCNFVRGKKVGDAVRDVEMVLAMKKSVPMRGEIPHRKRKLGGRASGSGRFPQNAAKGFLKLLRGLGANAVHNGLEDPKIVEAVANIGERPYGRFGQVRRKRTHVLLKVKEAESGGEK